MAVMQPTDYELLPLLNPKGNQECFYCGEPVKPPLIYWAGFGDVIFLHHSCAATWAAHLQSDFTRYLVSLDIKRLHNGT